MWKPSNDMDPKGFTMVVNSIEELKITFVTKLVASASACSVRYLLVAVRFNRRQQGKLPNVLYQLVRQSELPFGYQILPDARFKGGQTVEARVQGDELQDHSPPLQQDEDHNR